MAGLMGLRDRSKLYQEIIEGDTDFFRDIKPELAAGVLAYITPTRKENITVYMRLEILRHIVNNTYVKTYQSNRDLINNMYEDVVKDKKDKEAVTKDEFSRFVSTADRLVFVWGSLDMGRHLVSKYKEDKGHILSFLDYLESGDADDMINNFFKEAGIKEPNYKTPKKSDGLPL